MNKVLRHSINISIKELLGHVETQQYTKQTLESLFRSLVETIIDSRENSLVLLNLKNEEPFQGLLSRLKYSEAEVYNYSGSIDFRPVELKDAVNDEFLIIISDWFSVILFWNVNDFIYDGFCELNPVYVKEVVEHLQAISYCEHLEQKLETIKKDRRHNSKFNSILTKLLLSLETSQRDLICADSEFGISQVNNAISHSDFERFCSAMFHELRNPLGVVDIYAEIIQKNFKQVNADENTFESLNKSINFIKQAVHNMDKILYDLKESYKPLELNKEELNLKDLIQEVVDFMSVSFQEKKVNLSLKNNVENEIEISGDKGKLYQVFLNLLKNALEATEQGDFVEVNLQESESTYELLFIDNGIGVTDEVVQQMFLPYFTTKEDGSGIGLYLSRKIIETHGATLQVENNDKTIFRITFNK